MARWNTPVVEEDPVASAALAALTALVATDAELSAAVATLTAGIATKQDAATAATDAELASAIVAINAAMATDGELAAAVAGLTTALGLKQDALTAATDSELAAAVAAINAVVATDAEVAALLGPINTAISALQTDLQAVESSRGANNGIATLDNGGDVPLAQLGNVPGGFGFPQSPYDRQDDGSIFGPGFAQPSAVNAAAPLTTPTYDGSGEAVHPDLVYYPRKWNGWHYWMLFEPYPNANALKENPSMLVSNDGSSWQVPAGLTNPIVAEPPALPTFHSDGCLVKSVDGLTLHMVYRISGIGSDILYLRSSTDGVTWSAAVAILTGATSVLACPSIVYWRGQWHMWYVDLSSGTAANRTVLHTTAEALAGPWATAVATNLTGSTPGGLVNKNVWHHMVAAYGEQLHMLLYATGVSSQNSLHFGTSSDGLTWTLQAAPVLGPNIGSWDESMYRACMVRGQEPGAMYYDVFYSARTLAGNGVWRTGRTRLDFRRPHIRRRPGVWHDAPQGGSRTTFQFPINELRAVPIPVQAITLTGIALEVTVLGASAVIRYGLYLDDGEGAPGRLLRELGSFDAASTGLKAVTGLYVAVPSDTLWLAAVSQVSPPTIKAIDGDGGSNVEGIGGTNGAAALGVGRASWRHNATVSGALPTTYIPVYEQRGPRFGVLFEKK